MHSFLHQLSIESCGMVYTACSGGVLDTGGHFLMEAFASIFKHYSGEKAAASVKLPWACQSLRYILSMAILGVVIYQIRTDLRAVGLPKI